MKTNWFLVTCVCVLVSFLLFASRASGELIAYVSWCKESHTVDSTKIWRIDLDTGLIADVGISYPQMYMHIGISPLNNTLYGVSGLGASGNWEIDPMTGSISSVWGPPANCGTIAFDPDGYLYTHRGARAQLGRYDLVNQTGGTFGTELPQMFGILCGLAINSSGEAIACSNYKKFYSVDLSDGDFTLIGQVTGLTASLRGLDYDSSDRLVAFCDDGIYSIDIGSMSATTLMSFTPPITGAQGQGIAFANVPEPATITLLITGLLAGSSRLFRRRK